MGEDFSDLTMQSEGGFIIHGGGTAVDEDQINDKHIEVIVRQMMKKVRIEEPGDA